MGKFFIKYTIVIFVNLFFISCSSYDSSLTETQEVEIIEKSVGNIKVPTEKLIGETIYDKSLTETEEVEITEKSVGNIKVPIEKSIGEMIEETKLVWYEIPELGVEFEVSEFDFKDLILTKSDYSDNGYIIQRNSENEYLASINDNDLIGKCSYGLMSKISKDALEKRGVILEFNDYVITFESPHDSCFRTIKDLEIYENKYLEGDRTLFSKRLKSSLRKIQK